MHYPEKRGVKERTARCLQISPHMLIVELESVALGPSFFEGTRDRVKS
jgi:hypothetical protein